MSTIPEKYIKTVLFLIVSLYCHSVRSSVTSAVFRTHNSTALASAVHAQKILQCCILADQSKYTGTSVNMDTRECFRIESDGTLPDTTRDLMQMTKVQNRFTFLPQKLLYQNSETGNIDYLTEIPGEMTTGLAVEVTFQPVDPWEGIVIILSDVTHETRPLYIAFRNDIQVVRFKQILNGVTVQSEEISPPGGFVFQQNDIYKVKIAILRTHYEILSDGIPLHNFNYTLDKNLATHLYISTFTDSHAKLYEVVFEMPTL